MMKLALSTFLLGSLAVFPHTVDAGFLRPRPPPRIHDTNAAHACDGSQPNTGVGYFEQLLDHADPGSDATFSQKYFWSNTTWGGPGYPVILMTPGEAELAPYCGYLTMNSLAVQMAASVKGALILIEHRYYGDSSPFPRLTTQTLQHLTLSNSAADLAHFARNVRLPFDKANTTVNNAPHAPWILTGGSYSGALSAWTAKLVPGTFWAYHASSAPVQAIYNFWQFFEPIRAGMASNCSSDLAAITAYIDHATTTLTPDALAAFKETWGLASLSNQADFASAMANAVSTWQDSSLTSGYTKFFKMCDAIEGFGVPGANGSLPRNITTTHSNTTDVATKVANAAWYFKNRFLPGYCYEMFNYDEYAPGNNTAAPVAACLDTFNTSSLLYTDRAVNNSANVQWYWMLCNEPMAYWQTGSTPAGTPALVSRLLTADYFQRQCDIYFGPNSTDFSKSGPLGGSKGGVGGSVSIIGSGIAGSRDNTYGSAAGKTVDAFNAYTGGWTFLTKRILWVNGEFDPWRPASVSSVDRTGGPLASTPDAPMILITGGKHCEDLLAGNTSVYLAGIQAQEVGYMMGWVDDFYDAATLPGQNRTVPRLLPKKTTP